MAGILSSLAGGGLLSGSPLSDPETRLLMGAQLLSGGNLGEQLGGAALVAGKRRGEITKRNKTMEWLKQYNPELAQAVDSGALDPTSAAELAWKEHTEKPKQTEFEQRFAAAQSYGLDPQSPEGRSFILTGDIPKSTETGMPKRALNGIPMQDENGNFFMGQLTEDGRLIPAEMPKGYVPLDPMQRAQQGAYGKEVGEFQGSQVATAQKDVATADVALDLLDQIETHPSLDMGVGGTALFNGIPGTGGYDFQNLVEQAKSGAFLQAVQEMRGLGALSNAEGSAATAAITRMNTSTSKPAFLKAVQDYRNIVQQGKARAMANAGKAPQIGNQPPPPPQGNRRTQSGVTWTVR